MSKNLVIVESPAKAKTIEKYLGSDFKVIASIGHLRDLPKSKIGVDVEQNFEPTYVPVKGKEELIATLKKESRKADTVYLATDPDREGEAISWHLKELLELPDAKSQRVTFNEITKNVVQKAIEAPREIDMDLVDAQQARRILDRLVGYKLSPFLWKKFHKSKLSAGRVQSVATRVVVDREREIKDFKAEEYWLVDVILGRIDAEGSFTARYYGKGGKKLTVENEAQALQIIADTKDGTFEVSTLKKGEKTRSPSPPFITSTLQQEASRRLGMTPARTMSIAQKLYEGVDVEGYGTIGLITYMRTDSVRVSEEAAAAARDYIISRYGESYYPRQARVFKGKNGIQDAHEAIRPSIPSLTPEAARGSLTGEQYRLYRLIWERFIASQMANAVYDNVSIEVTCADHNFRANHNEMKFKGCTAVYEDKSDEESEEIRKPLPNLSEGEKLKASKYNKEQRFTQPPARFTEATLVRALEEKGIGRPSTYAPTISTITSRGYVEKEGRYLRPTPLGETVTVLMEERFPDIVDLKFTSNMESSLDDIEGGKRQWKSVMHEFYDGFEDNLRKVEDEMEGTYVKVPDEVSDEACPECGKMLVYKSGRFGKFLACPGFPDCKFTKPITIVMPGKCIKCGSPILKRNSRNGHTFYACERGADCGFMTWHVPVKETCPACGKTLFKMSGRGRKKPFCINENCEEYLPEEKRIFKKVPKPGEETEVNAEVPEGTEVTASAEKKPAARKTTKSSKTAKTASKTSKTAVKKPAAKKTASASTRRKTTGETK